MKTYTDYLVISTKKEKEFINITQAVAKAVMDSLILGLGSKFSMVSLIVCVKKEC